MVYSFARVGATVSLRVGDYFQHRERWWLRLHEKGGKRHEVPCHLSLEVHLLGGLIELVSCLLEARDGIALPGFRCYAERSFSSPSAAP